MSWSKPEETPWGAYRSEKEGSGTLYSKELRDGTIDRQNHVHFHSDGATITKDGEKYTIHKSGQ